MQLIKPMKSLNPTAVFTTKLPLSAAVRLTYRTDVIGSHYFQKIPKTAQTHCRCPNITNHVEQHAYCSFPNSASLIVFAVSETLFLVFLIRCLLLHIPGDSDSVRRTENQLETQSYSLY